MGEGRCNYSGNKRQTLQRSLSESMREAKAQFAPTPATGDSLEIRQLEWQAISLEIP